MRLTGQELFEDRPLQVLGINPQGYAGALAPGSSRRVPIQFQAPLRGGPGRIEFELSLLVSDTLPIDWTAVENEVRPPDVNSEVWAVLWPTLMAQFGSTWADYRQTLADDAGYLSSLERTIDDIRELFRYEVRKALGMNPRTILAGQVDTAGPGLEPQLRHLSGGAERW